MTSGAETGLEGRLRDHVEVLAEEIGERNLWRPGSLEEAADYLSGELEAAGLEVRRQEYEARGRTVANLGVEIGSPGGELVVVGAHYDTVAACPGANDNGSGCAALLELVRALSNRPPSGRLQLVFFVNEEPPFFRTRSMGSRRWADALAERGEEVRFMVSLETIGYASDEAGSQRYPFPLGLFYPSTGNFLGFVGNFGSRRLVRRLEGAFARVSDLPTERAAVPSLVPGVGWSDHWSFWRHGWPAVMVTDTAPFRYPWYHLPGDTPNRLSWEFFSRVVIGLREAIRGLVDVS